MTICDTNIWYGLNEKENSYKDLTITPLSIKEIANSPNLVNRIETIKNTVDNIFDSGNEVIVETPLEYLLSIDNQKYDGKQPQKSLENEFELLCKLKDGITFPKDQIEPLKKHIDGVRSSIAESTANLQAMLIEVRKNIKDNKKQKSINTIETTKNVIRKFVETGTQGKFTLSEDYDWSKIELFLYTLDAYFKILETNTTMKVKDNDWIDLFNLLYVSPDDKYLTEDKGILTCIKYAKMDKYLAEKMPVAKKLT
jgi:uncharacterized protein YaaR (DUF327 family)